MRYRRNNWAYRGAGVSIRTPSPELPTPSSRQLGLQNSEDASQASLATTCKQPFNLNPKLQALEAPSTASPKSQLESQDASGTGSGLLFDHPWSTATVVHAEDS